MDDRTNTINQDSTLMGTNTKESGATPSAQETITPVAAQPTTPAPKTDDAQNGMDSVQFPNQPSTDSPSAPAVSARVKLDLSADEAEMVQDLLNNFVYAYRSDREVDYKRELVPRDKVSKYPYVALPPAPEIINPAYDWVNKKWYSKNANDSLPDLAQTVADLKAKNAQLYQDREKFDQDIKSVKEAQIANAEQSLVLTQAVQKMTESQNESKKIMASMQAILVGMKAAQSQKAATPTETQPNQGQSVQDKNENGGN